MSKIHIGFYLELIKNLNNSFLILKFIVFLLVYNVFNHLYYR